MLFEATDHPVYDVMISHLLIQSAWRWPQSQTTVKRIFLTLASLSTCFLIAAVVMGLNVGDAKSLDPATQSRISNHMLVGLGALTFATLVHAISLTYFMGTGRWIEETSNAYSLSPDFYNSNQKNKYSILPGMTICMLLLIATGALGAIADPATPMNLDGTLGLTGSRIHFFGAIVTLLANLLTNFLQFVAISRNSHVVDSVLEEVRRIREERGLAV